MACHLKVDSTTKRFMRPSVKNELDAKGRKITKQEVKDEDEREEEKEEHHVEKVQEKNQPAASRFSQRQKKKSKGH